MKYTVLMMYLYGTVFSSAFEVEEGEQIRIHQGSVDEESGLRAEVRTLSEFSCTEGVLFEIANQQVRTLRCVGLYSSLSFVSEEVRGVGRGRGGEGGIQTNIEVRDDEQVSIIDRTTLICSALTQSFPPPLIFDPS